MIKRLSTYRTKRWGPCRCVRVVIEGWVKCVLPVNLVKGDGNVGQYGGNLVADACALNLMPSFAHGLKDAEYFRDVVHVDDPVCGDPFVEAKGSGVCGVSDRGQKFVGCQWWRRMLTPVCSLEWGTLLKNLMRSSLINDKSTWGGCQWSKDVRLSIFGVLGPCQLWLLAIVWQRCCVCSRWWRGLFASAFRPWGKRSLEGGWTWCWCQEYCL